MNNHLESCENVRHKSDCIQFGEALSPAFSSIVSGNTKGTFEEVSVYDTEQQVSFRQSLSSGFTSLKTVSTQREGGRYLAFKSN